LFWIQRFFFPKEYVRAVGVEGEKTKKESLQRKGLRRIYKGRERETEIEKRERHKTYREKEAETEKYGHRDRNMHRDCVIFRGLIAQMRNLMIPMSGRTARGTRGTWSLGPLTNGSMFRTVCKVLHVCP
jgi:hypothetical protein